MSDDYKHAREARNESKIVIEPQDQAEMKAEKPVGVNDENDYDRNTYTPEQMQKKIHAPEPVRTT